MRFALVCIYCCRGSTAFTVPPQVVSFACGGVAGALGAVVVYPLDYVKTVLQTREGASTYRNGAHAFRSIVSDRGPLALYRGLGPQVAGVAPEKALKIFVNDAVNAAILTQSGGAVPLAGEAFAGFTAGCCQVVVTNPLEAVKIRLQTSTEGSALGVMQSLGMSGLYRGALSCVMRDGTFSLVLFPIYAHAKEALVTSGAAGDFAGTALSLGLAGFAAATPAAIASTPFDVVKTRLQAACHADAEDVTCQVEQHYASTPAPAPARAAGARLMATGSGVVSSGTHADGKLGGVGCGRTQEELRMSPVAACLLIMREEGAGALFSGCLERVMRSAPQFAVTLSCADMLKHSAHAHGWM